MALYHASTKSLSRSAGRSAVAAAAYRAGVALEDERQGQRFDYARRRDVLYAEVLTPDGEGVDREALWNAAEAAERRKDARTAREWELALPAELPAGEQKGLARAFAQHLVERYGVAVDLAMHAPHGYGDERNVHVHLLCTTRRFGRTEGGAPLLGEKVSIELSDAKKKALGLPKTDEEIKDLRRVWAELTNAWLQRNGIEERVDHRSHAERGIDREATLHLGPEAAALERAGVRTRIGEENRAIAERNAERERLEAEELRLAREIEVMEQEQERLLGIQEAALARQARRDVEALRARWEARNRDRRRRRVLERAQNRHANRDHTQDARLSAQMRWEARQWERERAAEQAREAEIAREVQRAAVLAEWMREHPRQAKAQRLAGGKLPGLCPEGLDRQELRRPALWQAAEAWLVGRYGSKAEYDALAVGEGIAVDAAKAGREAAYDAWARDGLTLRVGRDAPRVGKGLVWSLERPDRESVDRLAKRMQERRVRSGSTQAVRVSFGASNRVEGRVLVLERLLRQGVPLEEQALDKGLLDRARRRIQTHEADGGKQAWYAQEQEDKRKKREEQRRKQREQERERLERMRQADAATERESRPGMRHPEKPVWQAERERLLLQAYGEEVAERLGRWYRITRESGVLVLKNQQATITDHGDRVTVAQGNDKEVEALVLLAQAKGWETVTLTGSMEFQEKAGRAMLDAGIRLSDTDLQVRLERQREAERERREVLRLGRELCEFVDHADRNRKDLTGIAVDLAVEYGMEEKRLAAVLRYLVNERGRGPGVGIHLTSEQAEEVARAAGQERLRREAEQARTALEVSTKKVTRQPARSAPKKEQGQELE